MKRPVTDWLNFLHVCVNRDFLLVNTSSPVLAFLHIHVHI